MSSKNCHRVGREAVRLNRTFRMSIAMSFVFATIATTQETNTGIRAGGVVTIRGKAKPFVRMGSGSTNFVRSIVEVPGLYKDATGSPLLDYQKVNRIQFKRMTAAEVAVIEKTGLSCTDTFCIIRKAEIERLNHSTELVFLFLPGTETLRDAEGEEYALSSLALEAVMAKAKSSQ
jgi:hypothetical protein